MEAISTLEYLESAGKIIEKIKPLAAKYHRLTGRPLGVTGEIAEYEVIRLLKLDCCVVRQSGYDALRKKGKKLEKIQIKGRVLQDNSNSSQRLGSIKLDKEWDHVILIMFNPDFSPKTIYEATREVVQAALIKPGSKARNERGQLNISTFKSIARVVWG